MGDSSNIAFNDNVGGHQQDRSMSDHDENDPSCTFQKSTSTIETSVESPPEDQHIDELERGRCHHTWKAFVFIVLVFLGGLLGAWVIVFYQPVQAAASLPTTTFSPNNDNDGDISNPVLHDLPTPEECNAISRGETLPGQRNMLVEFLDVEVDVSYEGVTSIGALLPSLETTLKERLAPVVPTTVLDSTTGPISGQATRCGITLSLPTPFWNCKTDLACLVKPILLDPVVEYL